MIFLLGSLWVLLISSIILLFTARMRVLNAVFFLFSIILSCVLFSIPAIYTLINQTKTDCHIPLSLPVGEFTLGMDPLSGFFLFAVSLLFSMGGIYSFGYFKGHLGLKTGIHYAFYQLLLLSLVLVITAKDAVLFLFAWEMMTLTAYFLIVYDDNKDSVRKAGYLYLIATHAGTFFLWAMFMLMSHYAGSSNFNQMAETSLPYPVSGIIFVFALIGFGVKAGIIPLHIWLPHAHPAAPSHISAVLSGVLIKMGVFGVMRIIFIVKSFPSWCSTLVLVMGMVSGVGGVLYALGQHEIKKLLAYHSIENIGIMLLGMGIGLWGQSQNNQLVSVTGYAGALLHVFNHAVFKGLLFLSAGSVIRSTRSGEIDRLGGLLKRMPWTGHLFLVGSLSICGLPLFNGFISEWLIYRSIFGGFVNCTMGTLILHSLSIVSLALIGGLAATCFAKAFGAIFLGECRTDGQDQVKEQSWVLRIPMIVLSAVCVWIGLFPQTMGLFSIRTASFLKGGSFSSIEETSIMEPFGHVIAWFLIVMGIMLVLFALKGYATKRLPVSYGKTWGCGYRKPNPRMQYSASSFAQPILYIFRNVLGYKTKGTEVKGYFPDKGEASSHVVESSEVFLFKPLFRCIAFFSKIFKCVQYGYTQLYLLYFLIFLLTLLVWKMN